MRAAFSLVELSIVLVILGLLTGGILTGQSLIRAAELRSITTDVANYRTAIMTFRGKYFAMPGDMASATDFWTSAGGDGYNTTCLDAQTDGNRATCNGDGDGNVRHGSRSQAERFLAWKHLANAGLIEGSYTGKTVGPGVYVLQTGGNVPGLRSGDGHIVLSLQETGHAEYFSESRLGRNLFMLLGIDGTDYNAPILTPEESWNIDKKLDDGNPVYGVIFTTPNTSTLVPGCASTDVAATAEYALTDSSKTCMLAIAN